MKTHLSHVQTFKNIAFKIYGFINTEVGESIVRQSEKDILVLIFQVMRLYIEPKDFTEY